MFQGLFDTEQREFLSEKGHIEDKHPDENIHR